MTLAKIAFPESAGELAIMECLLEANAIPYFVHNAGFGSLYPGPRVELYNAITVMAPVEFAQAAVDVLAVLSEPTRYQSTARVLLVDKIRMAVEMFFFGWFIPSRHIALAQADDFAESEDG